MMGMWGLCFFIVGYARFRNDLFSMNISLNCMSRYKMRNSPCRGAVLRSLTEEEAELLQAFGEDVFGRHFCRNVVRGVFWQRTNSPSRVTALGSKQWGINGTAEKGRQTNGDVCSEVPLPPPEKQPHGQPRRRGILHPASILHSSILPQGVFILVSSVLFPLCLPLIPPLYRLIDIKDSLITRPSRPLARIRRLIRSPTTPS